uniref:Prolyl 4-hydroxylase alpha subunit domain-containing protein n=1 Tax=Chromera velia CCMP2878 TaxID=1169474 RepID=A0A0G4FCI4_9ALVE|eukprot:Cvel_16330.t1-p1 / transcript=Cvel_16330.t1 / gene=Cvel_16330 / organism=Chromera_velia_CCMP2878 / gene_product=hypothetical protein / transcript_product=hypothetical protein / location=Cvel_scaffold1253:23574-27782(-) / protein_length=316 / sequence_SO=supercontig / SO=protein_coding / is_pseudo=false
MQPPSSAPGCCRRGRSRPKSASAAASRRGPLCPSSGMIVTHAQAQGVPDYPSPCCYQPPPCRGRSSGRQRYIPLALTINVPEGKSGKKKCKGCPMCCTKRVATQPSALSVIFQEQKYPEPVYYQNIDAVAIPKFFSKWECQRLITFVEEAGFDVHQNECSIKCCWRDIVDKSFAKALWHICGLQWFMRGIRIKGMVPVGVNDVVRFVKYTKGGRFGRHIDQEVRRLDGRISVYSLRVFLNGSDREFDGGSSVFHMPFRADPVCVEAETGLALLYPQGEMCTVQEEAEVTWGCKHVLRADVLFAPPCLLTTESADGF